MRLFAAAAAMAMATAASASDIPYVAIQFWDNNGGATLAANAIAGVPAVQQDYFNPVQSEPSGTPSISSLTTAGGLTTSINFSATAGNDAYGKNVASSSSGLTNNQELVQSQMGTYNGAPSSVDTFTNVPSGNYDIYVYTVSNANVEFEMSLTTGTTTGDSDLFTDEQAGSSFNGTFIQVNDTSYNSGDIGNYIEFTNVSPVGGTIALTDVSHDEPTGEAVNAIQLTMVVPEPSSLALATLAVPLLMRRRRAARCEAV